MNLTCKAIDPAVKALYFNQGVQEADQIGFSLQIILLVPVVGLSLLIQHFQKVLWVLKFLLSPGLGSYWLQLFPTRGRVM